LMGRSLVDAESTGSNACATVGLHKINGMGAAAIDRLHEKRAAGRGLPTK
jgi:hypothetical protein